MRTISDFLDPRTKLILAMMTAGIVLAAPTLTAITGVYVIFVMALPWCAGFRQYGHWLLLVLPMSLFFGAITAWAFTPAMGALSGLKLLSLTTVGYLFFNTTAPEDLANALVKAGLPFSVAFVVGAGMQFIPILSIKAKDIMDAQNARGIPVGIGWRLLRHFPVFAVPLLIQAFQLAEELAEAMESRGFGRPGRTFFTDYRLGPRDYAALVLSAAACAFIYWLFLG